LPSPTSSVSVPTVSLINVVLIFLVIWYAYGIDNPILSDGNELEATYA